MTIRLGTRGSALALAQSGLVADAITRAGGEPVELVEIVTPGDRSSAPIASLGVGVFVSALRDALVEGRIDVAVHSYKDLPTAQPAEVIQAATGLPPCGRRLLWLWLVLNCRYCGGCHAHRGGPKGGLRRAGCNRGWYVLSASRKGRRRAA